MTQLEEQAGAGQLDVARHRSDYGGTMARGWNWIAIAVAAIAVSLPRLSGPIDLRWNAGVYYLLGTSLAQGHGYTMLSERGLPHVIELKFAEWTRDLKLRQPVYPPVLPIVVVLHEFILRSTDPAVVAPVLRKSFAAVFIAFGISSFALAHRFLPPLLAFAAATLCLWQPWAVFLSDLHFDGTDIYERANLRR